MAGASRSHSSERVGLVLVTAGTIHQFGARLESIRANLSVYAQEVVFKLFDQRFQW